MAVNIKVFDNEINKPLREILGICNTPKKNKPTVIGKNLELFNKLNFKYIRHHDASLGNPSHELVDVSRIFPLFHLDETDERNYRFNETDDYFSIVADANAEWEIRLGETIDHSGYATRIQMPPDTEKWARICLKIVKHYIEKGYNITSVTVWEEPENSVLFTGTVEDYYKLFNSVYNLFKRELPFIRIGGPTCGSHDTKYFADFIALCVKNGTKPDFISQTIYPLSVNVLLNAIAENRKILVNACYGEIPYVLSEWHYGGPGSFIWKVWHGRGEKGNFNKTECATFTATALMKMLDDPLIEKAYYYCWDITPWTPYVIGKNEENAEYFALYYFQRFIHETSKRVAIECDGGDNFNVIASKTTDGNTYALITASQQIVAPVTITANGKNTCYMYAIREDFTIEEAESCVSLAKNDDGNFTFEHYTGNAVYLLILE